ncbi:MAG: glycosyltransferase family 4 protein, partial [Blastocatellia bacterium]|nr:glycosyltransferase family 4 protein [Blastocatellia bacterium]
MTRVLLLNNVPSPNLKPLFDLLGRKSGWDLTVCYVRAWHRNVGWTPEKIDNGGPHRTIILDQKMPRLAGILGVRPAAALALAHILRRERPDYLICYGYTLMPQITAILWSIFTNTPFAISGDANIYCESARSLSLSKRYIKRWWLGEVVRYAAALLTVGTASRMFWEAYGAMPEKLFESRFAVDNDFYARSTAARKGESMALREKLGLTNKVVFLFVGRLIKRKNVDLIICALSRLKDDRIALVIAGDGEEYDSLAALAGDDRRVIFMGSVAPSSLPLCYAMADVLVLPARDEPWGLVINEAMAGGLAIISHRHCGATLDLVRNDNGLVLKTFSVSELAVAMKLLASDGRLR